MRWFTISGVAGRREMLLATGAAALMAGVVHLLRSSDDWWWLARWLMPLAGAALAALAATSIRRLHDLGRSGGWIVLMAVPFAGLLLLLALLVRRAGRHRHEASLAGAVTGGALVALLLLAGVLAMVWQPYQVPSGSMKPTLLVGDVILMRQTGAGGLERGDIAVVRHPVSGAAHVLRLVGLPGERIAMRGGVLSIDGTEVPRLAAGIFSETYAPQGPYRLLPRCRVHVGLGAACEAERLVETLPGGRRHAVLDLETRSGLPDDFGPVTVPAGMLFLLGDSRDNAMDSRFAAQTGGLGLVPVDLVLGRVDLILFSAAGRLPAFWNWRSGRILARIDRLEAP